MRRLFFGGICAMILVLLAACDCGHEWKDAACDTPKTCAKCAATEGEALGHIYDDSAPDCENPKLCGRCSQPDGVAKQHTWQEANCTEPKTCALCNTTEGAPIGHSWVAATCDAPKTCENCALTDGEAKGHSWQDATCVLPKICATCYTTEGEALGHDWEEATSENPKTCRVCAATDGEKLDVDPRFNTSECKVLFGTWKTRVKETVEMDGNSLTLEYWGYYEFRKDGTAQMQVKFDDREKFLEIFEDMLLAGVYAQFEQQGISKTQADTQFRKEVGMSIEEYCSQYAEMTVSLMEEPMMLVYYVIAEKLFIAESWKSEFIGTGFRVMGNKIHMEDGSIMIPVD